MDWFAARPEGEDPHLAGLASQAADLRGLVEAGEAELAAAELETRLLGEAAGRLRQGMSLQSAGEALLDLLQGPLDLATFYVARIEPAADLIHFPVFYEGGRLRRHGASPYSTAKGLSGRVLDTGAPLYVRDMVPEGIALGALLSRAEEVTGLIPQTWFGVPLLLPGAPLEAIIAFQVFPRDGFTEARRAFLQRMGRLLVLAASEELR